MSEFQEVIKKFGKCRNYVRDFFVYGFKSRSDFQYKSSRTYDDERRRIESWLSEYVQQDYQDLSKNISLQMDSNLVDTNPLYRVWKTKSCTDGDMLLHFYILDLLQADSWLSVNELTDRIMEDYETDIDPQMVRRKCKEYEKEGLLLSRREGKTVLYHRGATLHSLLESVTGKCVDTKTIHTGSNIRKNELHTRQHPSMDGTGNPDRLEHGAESFRQHVLDAISFFECSAPFGIVGNTLLDQQLTENQIFRMKHSFLVHTLEDEILLALTQAMKTPTALRLTLYSPPDKKEQVQYGLPLRIFVSTKTGRRYLCLYQWLRKHGKGQFHAIRLDQIKTAEICSDKNTPEPIKAFLTQEAARCQEIREALDHNLDLVWGVSFCSNYKHSLPNQSRKQTIRLTLHIQEETEIHILHRLEREGRGGSITRIAPHTYRYEKTVFDAQEAFPWLRTFICRIIDISITEPGTEKSAPPRPNRFYSHRFYGDLQKMFELYDIS